MKSVRRILAPLLFFFAALAAVSLSIFTFQTFEVDSSRLNSIPPKEFSLGWQLVTESGTVSLPRVPRSLTEIDGRLHLQNRLPEDVSDGDSLCFLADSEDVELSVDGETVYSYGKADAHAFGGDFGAFWCLIPMRSDYAGKIIDLSLTHRGGASDGSCYTFYLDHHTAIFNYFLMSNSFLFINSLVCVSLAAILLLLGIHRLWKHSPMGLQFLYLGLTAVMINGWATSEANVFQLLFDNRAGIQTVKYLFFFEISIPLALFLAHFYPEYDRLFRAFSAAFSLFALFAIIAYAGNRLELRQLLPVQQLMMCLLAAASLAVMRAAPKTPERQHVRVGLICFALLSLISLMLYLYNPHPSLQVINHSELMLVGTNVLVLGFLLFSNQSTIHAFSLAKQYEEQAFTDAPTGIGNRSALEAKLDALDDKNALPLALFMVDLDNLKKINDADGHDAGDLLILKMVEILKSVFAQGQIFRYGGDEFVVLLEGGLSAEAARLHEQLAAALENVGQVPPLLRASVGCAVRTPGSPIRAHRLLQQADANMYAEKARHKARDAFRPA